MCTVGGQTPDMNRTAVVLFNLGGPDSLDAVEPFLFNLFNDPAIVGLPTLIRRPLARLISKRRGPIARSIYQELGGRSPLLELTQAQAHALEADLSQRGLEARTFVCMRYWHPMSGETAQSVAAYAPDNVVLLPLYPQFSTTTSGSSIADWRRSAGQVGVGGSEHVICCYPTLRGFIAAQVRLIRSELEKMKDVGRPRVLFSAHGLPKRIVARGDPYPSQVEQSANAIISGLGLNDLDTVVCFQSRVGPLQWIGPETEEELQRAGQDGVPVVVVPIAFVSEHSETLVELDIEYAEKAVEFGVPHYARVPAVGTSPEFVSGLADLVEEALQRKPGVGLESGDHSCLKTAVR